MTQDKKIKKAVRARMAKTGESYSTARRHVVAEPPPTPRKELPEVDMSSSERALRESWPVDTQRGDVKISLCEFCDGELAVVGVNPLRGPDQMMSVGFDLCGSCAMSMIQDGLKAVTATVATEDREALIQKLIADRKLERQRRILVERGERPWEVAPDLFESPFPAKIG